MPTKYTRATAPVRALEELPSRRGRSDWHPPRALRYAWERIDPIHGRGGSHHMGRPSRPGDPGYGDAWTLRGFLAALQSDREEIEAVVAAHPEQGPRLLSWLELLERLGQFRNDDPTCTRCSKADYYELLSTLGYTGRGIDND